MKRTIAGHEHDDQMYTPQFVLDWLGPIDLDPCWDERSLVRPQFYIDERGNGLAYGWDVEGLTFVNPPYSEQARWIAKCAEEGAKGRKVVALVQAKPGERVWMEHVWPTAEIVAVLKGRLTFVRPEGIKSQSATFNSALVWWGAVDGLWQAARERASGHKHEPVWLRTVR
jgi:phage N-6-adenine-methyltransferase